MEISKIRLQRANAGLSVCFLKIDVYKRLGDWKEVNKWSEEADYYHRIIRMLILTLDASKNWKLK